MKIIWYVLSVVIWVLLAPFMLFGFLFAFALAAGVAGAMLCEQVVDFFIEKLEK